MYQYKVYPDSIVVDNAGDEIEYVLVAENDNYAGVFALATYSEFSYSYLNRLTTGVICCTDITKTTEIIYAIIAGLLV
jgi:hypothetical protein